MGNPMYIRKKSNLKQTALQVRGIQNTMNRVKAHEMLAHALQHIYDESQEIKSYQHTENGVTMTLYVDTAQVGHLSFTTKGSLAHEEYDALVANLGLLDCQYKTKETIKDFEVLRYHFIPTLLITEDAPSQAITFNTSLSTDGFSKKLYWMKLKDDQCHICHRELTDPLSLKVKIGPICRKHIEEGENKTSEMWENIPHAELENIWTRYNTYQQKYDKKQVERNQVVESKSHLATGGSSFKSGSSTPTLTFVPNPTLQPQTANLPEPTCKFCGQVVKKYWHYDQETGLCECWDCSRKSNNQVRTRNNRRTY